MSQPSDDDDEPDSRPFLGYPVEFWWAYAANAGLVAANSLLIRYAEFVRFRMPEDTAYHLGWICGLGMLGSVLMRLVLGKGMDVYGPRRVWLAGGVAFVLCMLAHLTLTRVDTPPVYLLRIVLSTSLAGVFGASMVYVSRRASPARMAEVIGTLGTSGFLGMLVGPAIGDFIFPGGHPTHRQVTLMFLGAAAAGTFSLICAVVATRGSVPTPKSAPVSTFKLLARHTSASFMLMSIVMGLALGFPLVFLADFAAHSQLGGIWTFFGAYALTAFLTRLLARRFPQQYGVRRMSQVGLIFLIVGYLAFLGVYSSAYLIFPAVLCGAGHAFIFPAVVAGGAGLFPERYRGLGTSLMLLGLDLGTLLGGPLVGSVLRWTRQNELPGYPTVFLGLAGIMLLTLVAERFLPRPQAHAEESETPANVPAVAVPIPVRLDFERAASRATAPSGCAAARCVPVRLEAGDPRP